MLKLSPKKLTKDASDRARSRAKRLKQKIVANKKRLLIGVIVLVVLSLGVIIAGSISVYSQNRAEQEKKVSIFNKSNMQVTLVQDGIELLADMSATKLNFNFATPDQVLTEKLAINIQNKTNLDYSAEIKGTVDNIVSYTTDTAIIDLPAGKTLPIEMELPLKYTTETGKVYLYLKIPERELKYEWVFGNTMLTDAEVINTNVATSAKALVFASNQKPMLPYTLEINNQSSLPINEGYYELHLVNADNKEVQPLIVEGLSLAANEKKKLTGEFQFSIPPADLQRISKAKYKLHLIVKGSALDRKIQSEAFSSEIFEFDLKSY